MKKRYIPEGSYRKAKSAHKDEFVELVSGSPYKGFYIEDSKGRFYGGKTPQETGPELVRFKQNDSSLKKAGMGLFALVGGFFLAKLTQSQRSSGVLQRHFLQDRNNNKITEVDRETYLQAQKELANTNFAQVDWSLKGPAEDKMLGNYPYEGAESKNKKAIQALESQIKGISTFITDYKYLVEDPATTTTPEPISQTKEVLTSTTDYLATTQKPQLTSQTFSEPDSKTQLENLRKASFDSRK